MENRHASVGTVLDEVSAVLTAVSSDELAAAAQLFAAPVRRWFCCGQGRSGLVAHMVAMRLMHAGFDAHAVGEPTTPSIAADDGLLALSGSGSTPVTLHFARLARDFGARVLVVTTDPQSELAALADRLIVLPATGSTQFGGTLFEQSSLLTLDALVLMLTAAQPDILAAMQARHANLQ